MLWWHHSFGSKSNYIYTSLTSSWALCFLSLNETFLLSVCHIFSESYNPKTFSHDWFTSQQHVSSSALNNRWGFLQPTTAYPVCYRVQLIIIRGHYCLCNIHLFICPHRSGWNIFSQQEISLLFCECTEALMHSWESLQIRIQFHCNPT